MAAPRFLFVHGAWHGAWCFDLIRLELQHRAVSCQAVDLPAMGDDGTELDAATFEAGVERVLGMISGRRCYLVGHSLGGFYATEAALRAAPGRVRGIIYLASYVPVPGDTFRGIQEVSPLDDEMQAAIRTNDEKTASVFDPAVAGDFLYHDVAEGIGAAAVTRLKPQPLAPLREAHVSEDEAGNFKKLERRVIVAEEDRVLRADHCVAMADRAGVSVESIPTGHCPFLAMPKLLADQLLCVNE